MRFIVWKITTLIFLSTPLSPTNGDTFYRKKIMTDKPKLTIKKPLSLEKQSQLFQILKPLHDKVEKEKKQHLNEQKKMDHQAKIKKSEEIKAAVQWLLTTYPECFNQEYTKPLKLKIEEDIFKDLSPDHKVTKMKIRQAIAYYTRNTHYLKAVMEGMHRFDLKGQEVEEITPQHKAYAQERLNLITKAIEAKKRVKPQN